MGYEGARYSAASDAASDTQQSTLAGKGDLFGRQMSRLPDGRENAVKNAMQLLRGGVEGMNALSVEMVRAVAMGDPSRELAAMARRELQLAQTGMALLGDNQRAVDRYGQREEYDRLVLEAETQRATYEPVVNRVLAAAPTGQAAPADDPFALHLTTGIPALDRGGFQCEPFDGSLPPVGASCSLNPAQAAELRAVLRGRIVSATESFRLACTQKILSTKLEEKHSWLEVADVLLNILSSNLASALIKFAKVAKSAAKAGEVVDAYAVYGVTQAIGKELGPLTTLVAEVPDEVVKELVGTVIGKAKAGAKGALANLAKGAEHRNSFLAVLRDQVEINSGHLAESAPVDLDHAGQLKLAAAYDHQYHTTSIYERGIDAMLRQYQALGIDQIGQADAGTHFAPRREVVAIKWHGRLRRAVVLHFRGDTDTHNLPGSIPFENGGYLRDQPPAYKFVGWVDGVLGGVASAAHRERVSAVIETAHDQGDDSTNVMNAEPYEVLGIPPEESEE